jgi:hypothetical protein
VTALLLFQSAAPGFDVNNIDNVAGYRLRIFDTKVTG